MPAGYRSIAEQVRVKILAREFAPGDRLPSIRALAKNLDVAPLTVFRAYEWLKESGLVDSFPRSGYRVADPRVRELGRPLVGSLVRAGPMASFERISYAAQVRSMASSVGNPAFLRPDEIMAELREVVDPWAFFYPQAQGEPVLRFQLARRLQRLGVAVSDLGPYVTHGSLGAILALLDITCSPGETVLIQEPGRVWLQELLGTRGLKGVAIRCTHDGLDPEHLENLARMYAPKCIVLAPDFGHGTGIRMTPEVRRVAVETARHWGCLIIEDGSFAELGLREPCGAPLQGSAPEIVAYVGSLSYCLSAGLRLGFVVPTPDVEQALGRFIEAMALSGPPFVQRAMAKYIDRGKLDSHLRRVLPRFEAQRRAAVNALATWMPDGVRFFEPAGGLSLWLTLPVQIQSTPLFDRAIQAGVAIAPGRLFPCAGNPESHVRLSYGMLEAEELTDAIRTLSTLMG